MAKISIRKTNVETNNNIYFLFIKPRHFIHNQGMYSYIGNYMIDNLHKITF